MSISNTHLSSNNPSLPPISLTQEHTVAKQNIKFHWWQSLQEIPLPPLEVVPRLTFLMLLLHFVQEWYLMIPISIWAIFVLVLPRGFQRPQAWWCITLFLFTYLLFHWHHADNHHYAITYLCLLLGIVFTQPPLKARLMLKQNSRKILGTIMLLSVVWKLISPTYLNGSFFHYTLLTDDRFQIFTSLTTMTPAEYLQENLQRMEEIGINPNSDPNANAATNTPHPNPQKTDVDSFKFYTNPSIKLLAKFLTWWTISIESLLTLAFLWQGSLPFRYRHHILILFALTTYSVATVSGFAWTLIVLAISQTEPSQKMTRLSLLLTLPMIEVFSSPVGAIFAHLLRTYFT